MWKKYFKVVNIVPGPVIIYDFGTVDFSSDNLSVELCKQLYENDCRYLQITDEGKKALYGVVPKSVTGKNITPEKKGRRKKE